MALNLLPREVLHDIISTQSPTLTDLRNYSLVCRNVWEVASVVMYGHLDLTFDDQDTKANEKTKQSQIKLFQSIASNPKLGSKVRTFRNYLPWDGSRIQDATRDADNEILTKAARNMKLLTKASFTANALAIQVITNVLSYSQLTDLVITRLKPEEYIWSMAPTSLKKLMWEMPVGPSGRDQNPWDTALFLIKVAETTCPDLESLDILVCDFITRGRQAILPAVSKDAASQYRAMQVSTTPQLPRLRHFGFKYQDAPAAPAQQSLVDSSFLDFVTRHSASLQSISISTSGGWGPMTRETLDFVLKVCSSLPQLIELTLDKKMTGISRGGERISDLQFLTELAPALASPKYEIERFNVGSIEMPFSSPVGRLFALWKNLKFLTVGDGDASRGPYFNDGRLDFVSYGSEVLKFIKELPQSLREVYLEINGMHVCCDDDSDFDPVCDFGTDLFAAMRNLHTCDIHAWISNIGGGLGQIPEKGVFYRRLAHHREPFNANVKDIWTSRMDCIYQESDTVVVKDCEELEGQFEGKDADEVWCDGLTSEKSRPTRRRQADYPDYSWPGWVNKVNGYAMFRKKS